MKLSFFLRPVNHLFRIFIICFLFTFSKGVAQNISWELQFDNYEAKGIGIDLSNNVLFCGTFNGLVDFDPSLNIDTITSVAEDGFLTKFSSNRNYNWTYHLNGVGYDWNQSINACKTDADGNIYIACDFSGKKVGAQKISPSGSLIWSRYFAYSTSSLSNFNDCNDIAIDNNKNTVIVGSYWGHLCCTTPSGTYLYSQGQHDAFICKLDSFGILIWGKSIGGLGDTKAYSVVTDDAGNIYCAGVFEGTCDFDPDTANVYNVTSASLYSDDTFLLKLNSQGEFVWVKTWKSNNSLSVPPTVSFDIYNEIVITCTAVAGIDFDPGPGTVTMFSNMSYSGNAFVLNLDTSGQFKWVKVFSASTVSTAHNIDPLGNILLSGTFSAQNMDIDPGPDSVLIYKTGSKAGYFAKLNQNGQFISGGVLAASIACNTNYILPDGVNEFYISGNFSDTLDIDPGPGYFPLIDQNGPDLFLIKYNNCGYTNPIQVLTSCGPLTYNSQVIATSGIYYQTFPDITGCDSIVILDVTIYNEPSPDITGDTIVCGNGSTILGLSNLYSIYEWSTGEITSSIIVSSPGSYQITVTDQNGCLGFDSVTVLQVANPAVSVTAASSTIFCQGDSVLLSASPALASYQWYRRNYAIPGATFMSYTVKSAGLYKCIAQNSSGCSDTSNLIVVYVPCIPIGPNQNRPNLPSGYDEQVIKLFPNPTTGIFVILSPEGQLDVINSYGQLMRTYLLTRNESTFDLSDLPNGIYILKLNTGESNFTEKVILNH